ncbi:TonB-dependent receptor plug domain-containing protein, partial [Acinetobacter baumannii]
IGRLPGVATQTQQGRGEVISIRGFSGDFTGALLNHREIATIDDNRRYDYGQLPGDLFGRVDVIKTASADVVGTGLAGT